jgi:hypothetical protein
MAKDACADNRWTSVVAGITLCYNPGLLFVFSVYSGALKAKFGLSQGTLVLVGLSGMASQPFSWVWGLLNDAKGPRVAATMAGLVGSTSYLVQWMAVRTSLFGDLSSNGVVLVICIGQIFFDFGTDMVIAAVFATNVRNFKAADESGSVTGLLKCALGLCGAIVTCTFTGFVGAPTNDPSTLDFLLFQAIFLAACTLLPAPFIRVLDAARTRDCGKAGFKLRMRNGYTVFRSVSGASPLSCGNSREHANAARTRTGELALSRRAH